MVAVFGFGSYAIRNGDLLAVSVYGHSDLSSEVLVGPDGNISVPPLGIINVTNMTLEKLSEFIAEKYLENGILKTKPQLTIGIKKYAPYVYYALGELNNPGVFSTEKPSMTLPAILALSGGVTEKADLHRAFIINDNGEKRTVDLSKLINKGEGADIILASGDSLYIPDGYDSWIKTMGEFNSPGMVKYENDLTLTRVIALSKGLTSTADAEEIVVLLRDAGELKRKTYDLDQIFNGYSPDPFIEAGATIIVRNVQEKSIKVLGEVKNPGNFEYGRSATLLKILGEAGGLTEKASNNSIILRNGSESQYSYCMERILSGEESDVELLPGDTIIFPRNSERYVYIVSNEKSGRVDFTSDEKMTIRTALTRNNTYFVQKSIELKILSGDTSFTKNMNELEYNDREIETGTLILIPDSSLTVSVLGEFIQPGLKKYEKFEVPTLSSAIAKAGGLKDSVQELRVISGVETRIVNISEIFKNDFMLKAGDVVYAEKVPDRYVYVISDKNGGRVDFIGDEKQTLMNTLAKVNLFDSRYSQLITIISPDGTKKYFDTSNLPVDDFPLTTGTVVSCPYNDREISITGYVKNPGILSVDPDKRDLSTLIAMAGGLLPEASNSIMIIDKDNSTSYKVDFEESIEVGDSLDISYGSAIYVPKKEETFAYIIGEVRNPGIVFFEDTEELTLGSLVSRAGGISEKAGDIEVTSMGKTMQKKSINYDEKIETGSLVCINKLEEKFAYLITENSGGRVELPSNEALTLRNLLGRANLLSPGGAGELKIVDPDGNNWSCSTSSLLNEDFELPNGSVVIYPETSNDFYILGNIVNPGPVSLDIEETPYLTKLIAQAGGYTENADLGKIQVANNGNISTVDLQRILSGNAPDLILKTESMIIIPETKEQFVYVVSDQTGGKAVFNIDEKITLRNALAKFNLLDFTSDKGVIIINSDGTRQESVLSDLERTDITLSSGTIVYYPDTTRQFVVLGAVNNPGIVSLYQGQPGNLSTIISLAGGTNDNALSEKIRVTDSLGKSREINLTEILMGKKPDVVMQAGSMIYVQEYIPFNVNVLGEVKKPGLVSFNFNESPTLLNAIAKAGGILETGTNEIKISGSGDFYEWLDLINSEDILLERDTTIYIPKIEEKYAYVIGKVGKPGKIEFSSNEQITLFAAINKAGGPLETADKELKLILPSGDVSVFDYEDLVSGELKKEIETGSTIVFKEKVKRITVIGGVKQPGSYVFTRYEKTSLTDVLARAGGVDSPENIEKIAVTSDNYSEYDFDVMSMNSVEIDDGSIVYVVVSKERRVTVLGFVENPGTFTFKSSRSTTLTEVLSVAGGLKGNSEIYIISSEGIMNKRFGDFSAMDLVKTELMDGDTVVVGNLDKGFITVIGDVAEPGLYDVSSFGGNLNLGEALALAGGLKNQETTGKINVSNGDSLSSYSVSPDNFSEQTMVNIKSGSVVYVPPRDSMKIFVFGEVKNPGVIQYIDGMTAIEAILKASGPTENAVMENVLLFKDDLSASPIIINLEQSKDLPLSGNELLEPGNIIYVSPSNLVDIKETIGIIASSLALINNAISIVK